MPHCSVKSFSTGLVVCTKAKLKDTFNVMYALGLPALFAFTLIVSAPDSQVLFKLAGSPWAVQILLVGWLAVTAYGHYRYEFKLNPNSRKHKLKRGLIQALMLGSMAYFGWAAPQIPVQQIIGLLGDVTFSQYFWAASDTSTNLAQLPLRAFLVFGFSLVALLAVSLPILFAGMLLWTMFESICKAGQEKHDKPST